MADYASRSNLPRESSTRAWLLLLAGLVILSLLALGWLLLYGSLPPLTRLQVRLHSNLAANYGVDPAAAGLIPLDVRIIEEALKDEAMFGTPVAIQRILLNPVPSVTPGPGTVFPTPTVPTATPVPPTDTPRPTSTRRATSTRAPTATPTVRGTLVTRTPTTTRTATPGTPTPTSIFTPIGPTATPDLEREPTDTPEPEPTETPVDGGGGG